MKAAISHPPNYLNKKLLPKVKRNDLNAEVVWTYLVAKKYANNPHLLVEKLCGNNIEQLPENCTIWLESYLYPTRIMKEEQKAWKTCCDLIIGHCDIVKGRKHQIRSNGEWVCVAESKWFDDLHVNPKFPRINQLAQIIDHTLLLHDKNDQHPERVYVVLITPRYFKENQSSSSNRLYWSKYNEYRYDQNQLEKDLRLCPLPFLKHDIDFLISRIKALTLNWVTFEELFGVPSLVDYESGRYRTIRDSWKEVFCEIGEAGVFRGETESPY